jgi:hypothetical protein
MKRLLPILFLAGCATDPATMKLAIDAHQSQRPTLRVTCPAGGCEVEYTDPRDKGQIKLPTNGWDFANNVVSTTGSIVQGAVVPAAFAFTAARGFDALKGSGQVTTTTTSTNNATTTTLSGTGVIGSGTHNPTTTTNNTTTTDSHDATATPVVVNPVVVNPVVVRP